MDCIHHIQSLQCVTTQKMGIPPELKDLPNFCLEKESLRLFIIYGWEKEGVPVFVKKGQSGEGF